MALVLDASVAAAWYLADESSPLAEAALERLGSESGLAPTLFWYEIRNLLISQERRGRIGGAQIARALANLSALQIRFELPDEDSLLALARTHRLTVYAASYLSLALSGRLPLATLDRDLAAAARRAGVALLAA